MRSPGIRVLVVILAVVAQAAAGLGLWRVEQRIAADRSAADTFEREARQVVVNLGDLRAAEQACVAQGQAPERWRERVDQLRGVIGPGLASLRRAAVSVEAQAALEAAIEAFSTFGQSDAKARDYLAAGQALSASDVIFAGGANALERVVNNVDNSRGQESIARAVAVESRRRSQYLALGAGVLLPLLALLLLVRIPNTREEADEGYTRVVAERIRGLGLASGSDERAERLPGATEGRGTLPSTAAAAPGSAAGPGRLLTPEPGSSTAPSGTEASMTDLPAIADLCAHMAQVQDAGELAGVVERIADVLDATGVIVWVPDAVRGQLRPALNYGFSAADVQRMGSVSPAADNATATAFRTRSVRVVPAEPSLSGAVVAPLLTPEGCAGVLAVELREGIEVTAEVRAVAAIVAAQLATLLMPIPAATPTPAPTPPPAPSPWPDANPLRP